MNIPLVHLLYAACVAVFIGTVSPTYADPARVDDLWAEDYEVRRSATDALMLDEGLTVEQLAAWYAAADDPEARQRLLVVARHHFLRRARLESFPEAGPGSIGVVQTSQISPADVNEAEADEQNSRPVRFTLITRVLEGFPASGRLRPLDRVVAVDSQALGSGANSLSFEDLMGRYRASQELTLTVQRNGETLEIVIPLTNRTALGAMYAYPEFGLTRDFAESWVEYRETFFPPAKSHNQPDESGGPTS